jgi:predicted DNA-binding WGR domain protein
VDEGIGEQRARWEKGTRFYEALVECDLLGDWVLTLVWGRRGSALGRVQHRPDPSVTAAHDALQTVARCRQRRGYAPIG